MFNKTEKNAEAIEKSKADLIQGILDFRASFLNATNGGSYPVSKTNPEHEKALCDVLTANLRGELYNFQDYTRYEGFMYLHREIPIEIAYDNYNDTKTKVSTDVVIVGIETDSFKTDIGQGDLFRYIQGHLGRSMFLVYRGESNYHSKENEPKLSRIVAGIFAPVEILDTDEKRLLEYIK